MNKDLFLASGVTVGAVIAVGGLLVSPVSGATVAEPVVEQSTPPPATKPATPTQTPTVQTPTVTATSPTVGVKRSTTSPTLKPRASVKTKTVTKKPVTKLKPKKQKTCPTQVYLTGDSLTALQTNGAAKYAPPHFKKLGIKLVQYSRNGLSTRAALQENYRIGFGSQKAQKSKVWIVALGTNDQIAYGFRNHIRNVMKHASKNRTVYWVTSKSPRNWPQKADGTKNRALYQEAKRYKNLKILDFKKAVKGKRGMFTGDQVHMTTKGSKWRGKFYASPFINCR